MSKKLVWELEQSDLASELATAQSDLAKAQSEYNEFLRDYQRASQELVYARQRVDAIKARMSEGSK